MSDRDRRDDAIDEAVARAVERAAPADLRARVTARLAEGARPGLGPLVIWAAVAAAAVLAAFAIGPRRRLPEDERGPRVAATPNARSGTPETATIARRSSPAPLEPVSPAGRDRVRAVRASSSRGAGGDGGPEAAGAERPPDIDFLDVERLETPALETIAPLSSLPSRIAPLPTEPVVIAPLSLESGDSSPSEDMP